MQRLLENGPIEIEAEPVNDDLVALQVELRNLRKDHADMLKLYRSDKQQIMQILSGLRAVLGGAPVSGAKAAEVSADGDKWEKIKIKVGGKMSEIIDALQLSSPATRTQLQKITGGRTSTIDQAIYKLRDMGLIVKSGDSWRLKD